MATMNILQRVQLQLFKAKISMQLELIQRSTAICITHTPHIPVQFFVNDML